MDSIPMEAKFHLADIYLEELAKSADEHLTNDKIMLFIKPYLRVSLEKYLIRLEIATAY